MSVVKHSLMAKFHSDSRMQTSIQQQYVENGLEVVRWRVRATQNFDMCVKTSINARLK